MTRLKVSVCESVPELEPGSRDWDDLCREVSRERPELFVLNEMPFGAWIASAPVFEETAWRRACVLHEEGMASFTELGAKYVASSRPMELEGRRVNEAFLWNKEAGATGVHTKQFFPDEEGFYEARWFQAGERHFKVVDAGALRVGFLLCTEVMFNEHARGYGRAGAQLLLCPRAAGRDALDRWLVAMRMAAVVSGCYVLTSNRSGLDARGQRFGGRGWIIDPAGDLVAQTSPTTPVVSHVLETDFVRRAQTGYPCNVVE